MGVEELLDMPAFGKIEGQEVHFVAIRGRQEGIVRPVLFSLAVTLNILVEGATVTVGQFVG